MPRVQVRNLSRYQHYTNRRPPWLKLHRAILDNDYARLSPAAWRLGLEIALMCSEADDEIVDASIGALSWRLRRKIKAADVKALIDASFLTVVQDASVVLAGCVHDGGSEERRDRGETETETECAAPKVDAGAVSVPCLSSNGAKSVTITQAQIDKWTKAFPAVDVLLEIGQAIVWCEANPTKLKTERGVPRFLASWMTRTQNKGGSKGTTTNEADLDAWVKEQEAKT